MVTLCETEIMYIPSGCTVCLGCWGADCVGEDAKNVVIQYHPAKSEGESSIEDQPLTGESPSVYGLEPLKHS